MRPGWPLHVVSDGSYLRRRQGKLVVEHPDRGDCIVPLGLVSELVLMGDVGWTPAVCRDLVARGVPVVICDRLGRVQGRFDPAESSDHQLRTRQFLVALDEPQRLARAQQIVAAKLSAQREQMRLLERQYRQGDRAQRIVAYEQAVASTGSLDQLRGIEGAASAAYFALARETLPDNTHFESRNRLAPDVTNMGINYVSALLRENVRLAVITAGLDPTIGFLHDSRRGRNALVFDLMEEWRPALLDGVVFGLLRLGALSRNSIDHDDQGAFLSPRARKRLVERFSWKVNTLRPSASRPFSTPTDVFHRQARAFRRALRSGEPYLRVRWREAQ